MIENAFGCETETGLQVAQLHDSYKMSIDFRLTLRCN